MIKLFVGGFPLDMTELEIVQIVAMYANVVTIKIVRDKKTKICKGYAFLEIADRESAELAVEELNGASRAGRKLKLSIVEEAPAEDVVKQKRPRLATKI
jgi:RNA recognition motif-containing protein